MADTSFVAGWMIWLPLLMLAALGLWVLLAPPVEHPGELHHDLCSACLYDDRSEVSTVHICESPDYCRCPRTGCHV